MRGIAASGLEGLEATQQATIAAVVSDLGAPQNVRAERLPIGRDLAVTWDPVAGATAYKVQLQSLRNGTTTSRTTTGNSAQIALGPAGDYVVQVVALAGNGQGEPSAPLTYRLERFRLWPF